FNVNLIPHTLTETTLHELRAGTKVNLEIDLIARYVERMLTLSPCGTMKTQAKK
ncbi:MAG: riboflavin synthase, partial [Candidatus Nitrotoga sp.]